MRDEVPKGRIVRKSGASLRLRAAQKRSMWMSKKRNTSLRQSLTVSVRGIVLLACLAVIGRMLAPYFQAEHSMDELRAAVTESTEGEDFPVIDWDKLQRQNPDICGWPALPGTGIDYPIVAAPKDDPDYYLHRDIDGSESVAGVPYLDAACERDWGSKLSAIYGHHLINDGMFSPLAKYSNESFFNKHRTIYLLTPQESMPLTVVAANVVDADVEQLRLKFADGDDFHTYWRKLLKGSEIVGNDVYKTPEQVFCFMACNYETNDNRTLVMTTRSIV